MKRLVYVYSVTMFFLLEGMEEFAKKPNGVRRSISAEQYPTRNSEDNGIKPIEKASANIKVLNRTYSVPDQKKIIDSLTDSPKLNKTNSSRWSFMKKFSNTESTLQFKNLIEAVKSNSPEKVRAILDAQTISDINQKYKNKSLLYYVVESIVETCKVIEITEKEGEIKEPGLDVSIAKAQYYKAGAILALVMTGRYEHLIDYKKQDFKQVFALLNQMSNTQEQIQDLKQLLNLANGFTVLLQSLSSDRAPY
jgi:uncharacterized protein YegP (UPF0339 family)